ncbi:MAG: ribosome recycling factor [Candidatus Nealsonbacteria bacterium RIFOXYB1_FULL_40_15]|uniref:Ribosome recycling factor n=2 Tax=Candidatus Nealsoniibacteriota TaxID=1817911 RepID=A0A1G2EMB9_9BACT|nr:MAG: ribosome recycling factor [Candidatus Nealsonbacteria bacterium RIFOXYC1_FULL_40_7]OGZ27785.1 MAG: ribosome recycling factor [Candidatus Nealsonbacteria bacterium RIFOXYB1_FULL_40_15]OGZ28626.1 MAG: ribosome recycling factor [Candidatus Nealsonbacteria bacterium RIFOXYD1_FULL_39_11]
MNYKQITDKIKPELDKVIIFLGKEAEKLRAGRASASLVEDITIDCFGQKMPLKQLAAISVPEPKQIIIQPWDKSYLEPIEKGLSSSSIGINPIVDKDTIRLTLPPLTDEYRKGLLRMLSERQEEARKTIRHWRTQAWDEVQEKAKTGEIREDDKFKAKDELQKIVDEYGKKIDEIGENKKREIEL